MRSFRRVLAGTLMVAAMVGACGGSSGSRPYDDAPQVYAALVDRLQSQEKVVHATVTSPDKSTFEFWIDEAKHLAREDENLANVLPNKRKLLIVDGQEYSYVGNGKPTHWGAPSCEGVTAPATSLLLHCEGVAGSHSELVNVGGNAVQVLTSGSYGAEIANKPWTITLTLDADSLMPLSMESDLWGLLNNEPYETHERWTYETELVARENLPVGLFELKPSDA